MRGLSAEIGSGVRTSETQAAEIGVTSDDMRRLFLAIVPTHSDAAWAQFCTGLVVSPCMELNPGDDDDQNMKWLSSGYVTIQPLAFIILNSTPLIMHPPQKVSIKDPKGPLNLRVHNLKGL